ncbi:MAG: hypothetical protein QM760_20260 [Nibricoccus sp.]
MSKPRVLTPEEIDAMFRRPDTLNVETYQSALQSLMSGMPGSVWSAGDGSYNTLCHLTYLPDYLTGDARRLGDDDEDDSHNLAVAAFWKKYGLPWNSRSELADMFSALPEYFEARSDRAIRLHEDAAPISLPGAIGSVALVQDRSWQYIEAEYESFVRPEALMDLEMAVGAFSNLNDQSIQPWAPKFKPQRRKGRLGFFNQTNCAEFIPGPKGSHTLVFRFTEFREGSHWHGRGKKEWPLYSVYDLRLGFFLDYVGERPNEAMAEYYKMVGGDFMAEHRRAAAQRTSEWE